MLSLIAFLDVAFNRAGGKRILSMKLPRYRPGLIRVRRWGYRRLCPNRGAQKNKDAGCKDYEPTRIASDGGPPLLI
jgi:hypothetical protein